MFIACAIVCSSTTERHMTVYQLMLNGKVLTEGSLADCFRFLKDVEGGDVYASEVAEAGYAIKPKRQQGWIK